MESIDISKIPVPRGRWFRVYELYKNYIFFSKAALFILGLVVSYSLVEYAVVTISLDYLSDTWGKEHLGKASAIINFLDGVSAVSAVIVAHIADSCVGRFNMIVICTLSYITGLVLLRFKTEVGIYVGLLAIALGKSSQAPNFKAFLADQLFISGREDPHKDEEKIEGRTKVWWRIGRFSGMIIVIFVLQNASWKTKFTASIMFMGTSFLLFCFGFSFYCPKRPVESPLIICFRVFKAAISKRHFAYPQTPDQLYKNDTGNIHLLPEVRYFRWLDKAAIIDETPSISLNEQESRGMLCKVKQVSEVKRLLTLMPMWANFSAYCLVQATGNTSFIEQSSNLRGDSISLFFIYQSLMQLIIQFPFGLEKVRQRCGPLGKIGAGMVCCIFCCIAAWIVEIRRIHLIDRDDLDKTIPMSVYSLLPQFLLLGLMQGLAEEGLQEFVNDHIPDSMRRYGPAFNECVLGFGYFLSIPCLFLFRRWFQDYSTKKSHLERYFLFLAIFSTMCLCIYLYALPKYAQMEVIPSEDMEMELHKYLEDGADYSTESKITKSSSSIRWRKLANVTTATRRFYSPLATETGTGSTTGHYPESMEEIPLQSHSYTEDEELVPDNEPGNLQY